MSGRDDDPRRFAQHYGVALQEFKAIRRRHTRRAFCGREFVLASRVTEDLVQKSSTCHHSYKHDLDRLRVTAYMALRREPPANWDMDLERLEDGYLKVFYILLELGCPHLVHLFHNRSLTDHRLPLFETELSDIFGGEGHQDLPHQFHVNQYDWCPMFFQFGMNGWYDKRIVPGYRRERIQPRRDGFSGSSTVGRSARLWSIEVPEELMADDLKSCLRNANLGARDPNARDPERRFHPHDNNEGQRYGLALKTFPSDRHREFEIEKKMFTALKDRDGIIKYIGWYQSMEKDESNNLVKTYTIVLELAQFDLYKTFRKEAPPITPDEIHGFWLAMFDVAKALRSIHTDLKIDNIDFDMWHGDIKPENILRVDDRFKLADPGEARIQVAERSRDAPKANVPGGTRTYAAPEKSAYLDGKARKPQPVSKSIDVWSLGCVFSVAATFVVLGSVGVQQYDRVRRRSILSKTNVAGDAFHDGTGVLEAVKHWHEYLRGAARGTDVFTPAILDMVDKHMLLSANERWEADVLCQHLKSLLGNPEIARTAAKVPGPIEEILQLIDEDEEFCYEQSMGITRVDSNEMRKALPDQIRPTRSHIGNFKSRDELYTQPLPPTAQRSQGRVILPQVASERRLSGASTAFKRQLSQSASQVQTPLRISLVEEDGERAPVDPSGAVNARHYRASEESLVQMMVKQPVTIWEVRAELEASGKSLELPHLRNFRLSTLFKRQEQPVKNNKYWQAKDDPLQMFLEGRDIVGPLPGLFECSVEGVTSFADDIQVYLVDNGSSMHRHWQQVSYWMHVLVWRSLGYDDDGMELYFTNTETKVTVPNRPGQRVSHFVDALRDAAPAGPKPLGANAVRTNIEPILTEIMNKYMKERTAAKMPKKKTIIILTDGAWEGMQDEHLVENSIKSRLRILMGDPEVKSRAENIFKKDRRRPSQAEFKTEVIRLLEEERPITLQFIRFGHDEKGKERLRRLDDDLKGDVDTPHFPDLIDTEPADGDAYKMFLGSLSEDLDRLTTVVSTVPSTSISPRSSHTEVSLFDSTSRKNTAASETTSPLLPTPYGSLLEVERAGAQFSNPARSSAATNWTHIPLDPTHHQYLALPWHVHST